MQYFWVASLFLTWPPGNFDSKNDTPPYWGPRKGLHDCQPGADGVDDMERTPERPKPALAYKISVACGWSYPLLPSDFSFSVQTIDSLSHRDSLDEYLCFLTKGAPDLMWNIHKLQFSPRDLKTNGWVLVYTCLRSKELECCLHSKWFPLKSICWWLNPNTFPLAWGMSANKNK